MGARAEYRWVLSLWEASAERCDRQSDLGLRGLTSAFENRAVGEDVAGVASDGDSDIDLVRQQSGRGVEASPAGPWGLDLRPRRMA